MHLRWSSNPVHRQASGPADEISFNASSLRLEDDLSADTHRCSPTAPRVMRARVDSLATRTIVRRTRLCANHVIRRVEVVDVDHHSLNKRFAGFVPKPACTKTIGKTIVMRAVDDPGATAQRRATTPTVPGRETSLPRAELFTTGIRVSAQVSRTGLLVEHGAELLC